MKSWPTIPMLAVFLAACGPTYDANGLKPGQVNKQAERARWAKHTLTATDIAAVKDALMSSLKDPESARFGNMTATKAQDGNEIAVCGWVNARNSYGGYTGMQPFSVYLAAAGETRAGAVLGVGGEDSGNYAVRQACWDRNITQF